MAKNCELFAVKVLDSSGSGTLQAILDGLEHAATHCGGGKCVANLSLGFGGISTSANQAVANAVAAGVTVVVAAGNSNANACNYSPAAEPSAITGEYYSRFYLTSNLFHGLSSWYSSHDMYSYFFDFLFCSPF